MGRTGGMRDKKKGGQGSLPDRLSVLSVDPSILPDLAILPSSNRGARI